MKVRTSKIRTAAPRVPQTPSPGVDPAALTHPGRPPAGMVAPGAARAPASRDLLRLQRTAGNRAVASLLTLQRCGPVPCDCPPEKQDAARAELAGRDAGGGDSLLDDSLQRQAAEAGGPTAGPEPASGGAEPASQAGQPAGGRRAPVVHAPLTSPRFAGESRLQACAADADRLRQGDRGGPVEKVQQALTDLGYDLGNVDGRYGTRTAAAVRTFKADNRLGSEQYGDVGPGTIGRLDQLFPAGPPRFCPVPVAVDAEPGAPVQTAVETVVQTQPVAAPERGDADAEPCVEPPVPPSPVPVPPGPQPPGPVPPGPQPPEPVPPEPVPPEPVPPGPQPTPATPNFARNLAGCAITEPPGAPATVAALPFTPDPAATLPATETPLPLDSIKDSSPFWAHGDAEKLAEEMANCYQSRKPKDPKLWRDKSQLQQDFDDVLQASFTRSSFGTPWWRLPDRLVAGLQQQRAAFKKKNPKATDAVIELHMQTIRHKQRETVRQWEANAMWGWMVERRDRLDFETIGASGGRRVNPVPEILSPDQRAKAIHDRLDQLKRPLSEKEKKAALAKAAAAAGKQPEELTEPEQQAALAQAEEAKLKGLGQLNEGAFKKARIDAEQAAGNLVVPTTADFAGWTEDGQKTPVHKTMLDILRAIQSEFGTFSAGTYGGMSGEHASGGFKGRFRSLDMYPESAKAAAYFTKDVAFRFAEAIDTVAGKLGFTYQILYNDYVVAREFNARAHAGKGAEHGRMGNQDNVTEQEVQLPDGTKVKRPANLNWHGPLVTHFHVDFSY
ncbi:peptidoglycan-binding domain-containing protein [Micromonospora eburnea]|uniref:Putative peptidoglycan binding domain-containing protein n=1 Tax=Micromonospora eburnea TaxID=227316 RepID=A0A1C6UZL2_9ACTN|nr:peptidoglycan-binding domain-containing protein [Micromonospora eburnea]SCL59451.1 Putative peptidoglycan binding domain-containing protein [Micromonospora eburnea]